MIQKSEDGPKADDGLLAVPKSEATHANKVSTASDQVVVPIYAQSGSDNENISIHGRSEENGADPTTVITRAPEQDPNALDLAQPL